jgi:hypothetical protein
MPTAFVVSRRVPSFRFDLLAADALSRAAGVGGAGDLGRALRPLAFVIRKER